MLQIVAIRNGAVYPDGVKVSGLESIAKVLSTAEATVANFPIEERYNLYYTLAHHKGAESSESPIRLTETFESQSVIAFDIDYTDITKAEDYATVVAKVLQVPSEAISVVVSGFGVQLLCGLQTPIKSADFFKKNRENYKEILSQIKAGMDKASLPGDPDGRVFDATRLFRLPHTLNIKEGRDQKPCYLVRLATTIASIDLAAISGVSARKSENISPRDIKRSFPLPDFKQMVKECGFVKWCATSPSEVHEPDFFALTSLLYYQGKDSVATIDGKEFTPESLARHVFDNASASASLAGSDFEKKFESGGKYGARKCETIASMFEGCKTCPHLGTCTSPITLKSKSHIASEANGYWYVNAKGIRTEPAYIDLVNVFEDGTNCKTLSGDRLYVYNGKCYKPSSQADAKQWLINKLVPNDMYRDKHGVEFHKRLMTETHLNLEDEDKFLTDYTFGKVNCNNGVLDLRTGELSPHSDSYGFMNVVPYDYVPGLESVLFKTWLTEIMQGDPVKIKMAYSVLCWSLWPSYDEEAFVFFTGGGANGKSTFMDVQRALVGPGNYSSIDINQLCNNRFAKVELQGKMFNLAEEASGIRLGTEELGFIKNASGGGEIYVEEKNKQGYFIKNKAKLLFSANKIPRFEEDNHSIRRRLVVIDFSHKIEVEDMRVKTALLADRGAIMSMLVPMIMENVRENGGQFKLYRGGDVGKRAQEAFLYGNNTAIQWAKESLESSDDLIGEGKEPLFVLVGECYARYTRWCQENGLDHKLTRINFSRALYASFLSDRSKDLSEVPKKIMGKTQRVYHYAKFKEE